MWEFILNLVYGHFYEKYLTAIKASARLIRRPTLLTR
jgi:hypothetical protein